MTWVEDPSNQTNRYDRNLIRNEIIPRVSKNWSSAVKSIIQFSRIAKEQVEIINEVAEQDLVQVTSINRLITDRQDGWIDISRLNDLSNARKKNLLHYWVRGKFFQSPSMDEIEQVILQIQNNNQGAIKVKVAEGWIRSFNRQLFLCDQDEPDALTGIIEWKNFPEDIKLENGLLLSRKTNAVHPSDSVQTNQKNTVNLENLVVRSPREDEVVTIRPRIGGELLKPSNREHSTSLKKIYQELRVPVWEREWLPIIYYNEQIVTIPGYLVEKSMLCSIGSGITICLDLSR